MSEFMLTVPLERPDQQINYQDPILLMGSCFTEHIGDRLSQLKFQTLQNPHGILFDPNSVANSLISYMNQKEYTEKDLVYLNELWQSWDHHSRFSHTDLQTCLDGINRSQQQAHDFLKKANWLIITLGSSYSYRLVSNNYGVANCHRAPGQTFHKHLLGIDETVALLDRCLHQLFIFNPTIKIIFTISPVRHIRDGVVANNRSKARLIEAVQHLVGKFNRLYYFPAYEYVIDVLRDYRFYDIDMVHPNYPATQFVMERFVETFVEETSQQLIPAVNSLITAAKHRSFHPSTQAHQQFLKTQLEKAKQLQLEHPYLDFSTEIAHFTQELKA